MTNVNHIFRAARLVAVLASALAISACANKPGDDAQANAAGMATPGSQQDFVVNVGDRVFFETDSSELTPQSRATLDKQAQWLNNYSQYGQFTVEGHADERGTREYNLALGARRANSVKDFLVGHGVAASRIDTVSFGKEKPIDAGTTEEAYAKNRNGHTAITAGAQ